MYARASAVSTGSNSTYTSANNNPPLGATAPIPEAEPSLSDGGPPSTATGGNRAATACCQQWGVCWRRFWNCDALQAVWSRVYGRCLLPVSDKVLASVIWRVLLVIGNILLLFGNPIQMLWLPKGADPVMDVLYTLTLIVFLIDMIFRATAVAGYFGISVSRMYPARHPSRRSRSRMRNQNGTMNGNGNGNSSGSGTNNQGINNPGSNGTAMNNNNNNNSNNNNQNTNNTGGSGTTGNEKSTAASSAPSFLLDILESCRCISMGSFLFWCDLVSTLTLLYDIRYTNPNNHCTVEVLLDLQHVNFLQALDTDTINRASPWELNPGLMVTILKTARIVRFVRSQAVSSLISRVNWYWPLQKLNSIMVALDCCSAAQHYFFPDDDSSNNGELTPTGIAPGSPGGSGGHHHHHHHNHHGGKKDGRGGGRSRDDAIGASKTSNASLAHVEDRRSSWGGLGLATLAAVKAQRLAQETEEDKHTGFFGSIVKSLRRMGILGKDHTEWKRQLAATKIQRAWRRAVARNEGADNFQDELGMMGKSIGGSGSLNKSKRFQSSKRLIPRSLRKMTSIYPGMDATAISARISQKLKYAAGGDHAAESQVGGAMRELTGQRVAIGILVALFLTAFFTYAENDATRPATMVILHAQTTGTRIDPDGLTTVTSPPPQRWINMALNAAIKSSVPDLYQFEFSNGTIEAFPTAEHDNQQLRDREQMKITVTSINHTHPLNITMTSIGWFAYRQERRNEALVQLFSTIFILLLWLLGVTAFAGPVMVLVVLPIERMVRLLGMLMVDPLGYQSTSRYRRFVAEEDEITKNTRWTKEVLKGMETSFLMSTILRIGSLMKVGFGSAGVEIIRKNLEKKQGGTVNLLTSKGLTVSCIFLFCDIRQFTDATECLQEEVFVFTNRIAAVVHSFCHSYGGSANKNVGDAFLCSWLLDQPPADGGFGDGDKLYAKSNQADKCLLCVVKIIMALHHDTYYIETMSEAPRQRLLAKLKKRPGPVVQMGCGLHAGKAVQGAIGSERKIDATYVSEAVEMAEFLESSTKKYGLKMLMSNAFHSLLHPNNRQRCRQVDQIVLPNDDEEDEDDVAIMYDRDDIVELYTYDMDIDALWSAPPAALPKTMQDKSIDTGSSVSDAADSHQGISDRRGDFKSALSSQRGPDASNRRIGRTRMATLKNRNKSKSAVTTSVTSSGSKGALDGSTHDFGAADHNSAAMKLAAAGPGSTLDPRENVNGENGNFRKPELVLPTGPAFYNPTIWRSEQMFRIRKKYLDGLFFHNYSQGLQSFYHRDFERATQSFTAILDTFEDGPSRYFLTQIEKYGGKPPPNFRPYGMP